MTRPRPYSLTVVPSIFRKVDKTMNATLANITADAYANICRGSLPYPSATDIQHALEDAVTMAYAEGMNAVAAAVEAATFDAPSLPLTVNSVYQPYALSTYLGAD